jgi:nucleotide-binding universal stress UspA family protein
MYNKILVPLDGSEMAECVLPHVEAIGRGCHTEKVILTRVVEPIEAPPVARIRFTEKDLKELEADKEAAAREYLANLSARLAYDWTKIETAVLVGKPASVLVEYAKGDGIDLIIIATHGYSGLNRWVWGSTAERILQSSCIPVFMVRVPGCVPGIA